MKPYSADLRKRVAAACAAGNNSIGQVAARFSVSLSFVNKLLKRQRTSGAVAALPHRGGPAPLINAAARRPVGGLRGPAARRHTGRVARPTGGQRRPGRGAHHRLAGFAGAGVAAQKKSVHAAERDTPRVNGLRRAFPEARPGQDVTRFKFADETSVNLTYTRRYGRAVGGQRVNQAVPLRNGPNVTIIVALTPQGPEAAMELDGAVNAASFAVYLDQVLGPTLVHGDVVVPDNLRVHKAAGLAELVEKRGARLLFLPPYSPAFTPVERAFSQLKTSLRTAQACTWEALTAAVRDALDWISVGDAIHWFDHCGYHVR